MNNALAKVWLLTAVSLASTIAYAVPNSWNHGYSFGQAEYYIENEKNQSLTISCGADYGRSIYFDKFIYDDVDGVSAVEANGYSFLFDDTVPVRVTTTRNEDEEWERFNSAISKAKVIQVFQYNQPVALFKPLNYSIEHEIVDISETCAKIEHDSEYIENP